MGRVALSTDGGVGRAASPAVPLRVAYMTGDMLPSTLIDAPVT